MHACPQTRRAREKPLGSGPAGARVPRAAPRPREGGGAERAPRRACVCARKPRFPRSSSCPRLQSPLSCAARTSLQAWCRQFSQSRSLPRQWSNACTSSCTSAFSNSVADCMLLWHTTICAAGCSEGRPWRRRAAKAGARRWGRGAVQGARPVGWSEASHHLLVAVLNPEVGAVHRAPSLCQGLHHESHGCACAQGLAYNGSRVSSPKCRAHATAGICCLCCAGFISYIPESK